MQQSDRDQTQQNSDGNLSEDCGRDAQDKAATTVGRDDIEPGIAKEQDTCDHRCHYRNLSLFPERPCRRTEASQQDGVEADPGQGPVVHEIVPRQGHGQSDCPGDEAETAQSQKADHPTSEGGPTARRK